jgi:hypothetical protein
MGVGGQSHALATLLLGKTQYPLYRKLGGPQGQSGRMQKIAPPLGFNPWTIQPIASRYTNYAIPAPRVILKVKHSRYRTNWSRGWIEA